MLKERTSPDNDLLTQKLQLQFKKHVKCKTKDCYEKEFSFFKFKLWKQKQLISIVSLETIFYTSKKLFSIEFVEFTQVGNSANLHTISMLLKVAD